MARTAKKARPLDPFKVAAVGDSEVLIHTVVDPVNAVVDPLKVRTHCDPELLDVCPGVHSELADIRPLQSTHGQNGSHHHARGQSLPPLVRDAAKARRGFCLVCRLGCGWRTGGHCGDWAWSV